MQQLAWMEVNTDDEMTGIISEQSERKQKQPRKEKKKETEKEIKRKEKQRGEGEGCVEINEGE